MNYQTTNKNIEELSQKLKIALQNTLGLTKNQQVFSGNEEKIFLLALMRLIESSNIKLVEGKVSSPHLYGSLASFGDIFKSNIISRKIWFKYLFSYISIKPYLIPVTIFRLLKQKNIVSKDAAPYCAVGGVNNISYRLVKIFKTVPLLRTKFYSELSKENIDHDFAQIICWHFPKSHIESFKFLKKISSYTPNIKNIYTNVYCLHNDPLFGYIARNNNANLIYIQHGGGYGLNNGRIDYDLEHNGANKMFYWGTGKHNVFPSRFRTKRYLPTNNSCSIVMSHRFSSVKLILDNYMDMSFKLQKKYPKTKMVIYPYPGFNSLIKKNKLVRYGISNRGHERQKLVIYDSIGSTLMHSRLVMKRPFLVANDFPIVSSGEEADNFVSMLKEAGILLERDKLYDEASKMLAMECHDLQNYFLNKANKILEYTHSLPKLDTIIEMS